LDVRTAYIECAEETAAIACLGSAASFSTTGWSFIVRPAMTNTLGVDIANRHADAVLTVLAEVSCRPRQMPDLIERLA